ncbi:motile sperm domain-containing protein 2 [Dermatophagoides farinae]|uniref:Major sperm protein-like protein n=1 Tax=Dermatophagoides farinae TaxID=6954 RepID=A0A922I492_DERFA|nr:motile sperm domain-containing protein 2-like [Dermatophagoides farinae]KAH7640353.1 major sperm protein-like protein [Dermatophagoides farinae]KAH9521237.1 Motile sperm domain-containing protein 2 [Dermatophagoides farinae]
MSEIESLRVRFNKEVDENPSLYHPIDVERVQKEEWQVKRYLQEFNNNEEQAFELMKKALQWKKEFGIHDRTDQYFPLEFYDSTEFLGRDKQGRYVQLEIFRNQIHFKELTLLYRQYVVHNLERIDRMAGEQGFILLMDTNGAGVSNINLDLTKFKLNVIELYPGSLQQFFVIDLPWLLNPIMKIIVGFMAAKIREKLVYIKRQQLLDYMDEENLPVSLNGKKDKSHMPDNLERLEKCFERFALNEKFVDQYYSTRKIKRSN